jgi:hypothetical protein
MNSVLPVFRNSEPGKYSPFVKFGVIFFSKIPNERARQVLIFQHVIVRAFPPSADVIAVFFRR